MFNDKLEDLLLWLWRLSADGHTPKIILVLATMATTIAYGIAIFGPNSKSTLLVAQSLLAINTLMGARILLHYIRNKRMIWDRPSIRPQVFG